MTDEERKDQQAHDLGRIATALEKLVSIFNNPEASWHINIDSYPGEGYDV